MKKKALVTYNKENTVINPSQENEEGSEGSLQVTSHIDGARKNVTQMRQSTCAGTRPASGTTSAATMQLFRRIEEKRVRGSSKPRTSTDM